MAFDDWLSDPANRLAYEDVLKIGSMFGAVPKRAISDLVAEVESPARRRTWMVPAGLAAGAALLALVAIVGGWTTPDLQQVATRHGEQRSLTLPDGSIVQLNTDTQIAYRVDRRVRRIDMPRGEAFFDVAKDEGRTFVVRTPTAEIQVVGTQFNVRILPKDVEVIVKEGRVNVVRSESALSPAQLFGSSAPKLELGSGERIHVSPRDGPHQLSFVDASRATAWRSGFLDVDGTRLEDVVAEINRYSAVPLVIQDDSIRDLRLSGRFRLGETDNLRFMLRERLGVESEGHRDRIVLTAAKH